MSILKNIQYLVTTDQYLIFIEMLEFKDALNWTIGINGKITSTVPAKGWVHVFKRLSNGNENL